MTREEHIKRHEELHKELDELLADYIGHHRIGLSNYKPITKLTVLEFMTWSAEQMKNPTEQDEVDDEEA